VTQEFRVSTITKVVQRNQWQTVQNVVYKSNCKMGGLNYTLFANNQTAKMIMGTDTLIIGLAINHPSGGRKPIQMSDQASESASQAQAPLEKSAPSSVGFAANVGRCDEFEFVGDFIFQVCPFI
jgi:Piwi domain